MGEKRNIILVPGFGIELHPSDPSDVICFVGNFAQEFTDDLTTKKPVYVLFLETSISPLDFVLIFQVREAAAGE